MLGKPKLFLLSLLMLSIAMVLLSCDSDNPVAGNSVPFRMPSAVYPANQAVDQPLFVTLTWTVGRFVDDEVWYTVYFGTDQEPGVMADSVPGTSCDSPTLQPNTAYYWRVKAHNASGAERLSALWKFTTSDQSFIYPTNPGSEWYYQGIISYYNVQPESLIGTIPETMLSGYWVGVTGIDTINGMPVYVFLQQTYFFPDDGVYPLTGEAYLRNQGDGLYCYGSWGMTEVTPLKPAGSLQFEFAGKTFASVQEISTVLTGPVLVPALAKPRDDYDNPPLRCMAYPPEEEYQWNYRSADNPWLIDKIYLEPQQMQTPAGTFDCYVISWLYDRDADGEWDDTIEFYDYICNIGLVRRTYTLYGVNIVREDEYLGTCDITFDYYLTSYDITPGW